MPRSTSPGSVQRIIGVTPAPASDELLERLSRGPPPRYEPPQHHLDDLGDIEAELAKMHADHSRRAPTPILRSPAPPPDPPPVRRDPPRHTYAGPAPATADPPQVQEPEPMERLPLKADFPDKSLLEQLLIEIPTPDYSKRTESPSPSALERVARSSVRTRSSSKMNSPAETAPRTPRLSPAAKAEPSPRAVVAPLVTSAATPVTPAANKPAPAAKRKRRESESSCTSTVSCEEGTSPARPLKKKPRWTDGARPAQAQPNQTKGKKDSDSDSDEPLICKVRGKAKGVRGAVTTSAPAPAATTTAATTPAAATPAGGKAAKGEGVGTRRSVRHGVAPPPPAPPNNNTPVRRKTRSAGELALFLFSFGSVIG